MPNLELIGEIIQKQSENLTSETITEQMTSAGYPKEEILDAFNAIEKDDLFTVNTLWFLTPITPISYHFGIRKIRKEKFIVWGILKKTVDLAVRTIDTVHIDHGLIAATVSIMHLDECQMLIEQISRADAAKIQAFYAKIIEAQRKNIVNIARD